MTRDEFMILAAMLRLSYPERRILDNAQAVEVWYKLLQDIPYPIAEAAVTEWATTKKFAPSVAEIREACATVANGSIPDWNNQWDELLRLIGRYGWPRKDEIMKRLDDLTRQCVEVIGFESICSAEGETIAFRRKEFRDLYERMASGQAAQAQLPEGLVRNIEAIRSGERMLTDGAAG